VSPRLGSVSVPSDWTFVGDELRVRALSNASFNLLITAVVLGGISIALWFLPASGAGVARRDWIVGLLVIVTLVCLMALTWLGGRWSVRLNRTRQTVTLSRRGTTIGPHRFDPGAVTPRPDPIDGPGYFDDTGTLTIFVGDTRVVLAYYESRFGAVTAEPLRAALLAWMAGRVDVSD